MEARGSQQSKSAVCSCTLHGTCCAARLSRWSFLIDFPTVSAVGIWHWPNSPAARPATVVSRVTFWQPGLPQGGGARPCPTDHACYLSSYIPQDIPSWWGVSSMVIAGQSKLKRFAWCDAAATGDEFVDAATSQHVGRTASMLGSSGQRRVDAAFTAWPAFRDYGSYGSYGGLDAASERAPEAVLATSYSWWQRGSTPRCGFHGILPVHGVARCAAAPRPLTQRPSLPATPWPRY